ncbi:hypothetical protein IE53DRAFT_320199 [Violaceomyces palustris]|uniref:Uncharacterized protein n=1 Tax=Violaceomyces palustris TaxID=1673888 RepID=A0ACD0NQG0_9BASI|nr:hypothetical protein IE53DRAFT_320199 [Violaceomyces palustris]
MKSISYLVHLSLPFTVSLLLLLLLVNLDQTSAAPLSQPTPAPRYIHPDASPNAIYEFYRQDTQRHLLLAKADSPSAVIAKEGGGNVDGGVELSPTRTKRSDVPTVPLSELGPPTFPAQYASCVKCEEKYYTISSCMEASSVFANSTSIFNNPIAYFNVIKCACTDTFQAVYPQCVDCFQHTNQCWYLGTDPEGTGAWDIVTNIRQICAFGSALLGGVAGSNGNNSTYTPSNPGTYTDVTTTGAGYSGECVKCDSFPLRVLRAEPLFPLLLRNSTLPDQSTGPIFGSSARPRLFPTRPATVTMAATLTAGILLLAMSF